MEWTSKVKTNNKLVLFLYYLLADGKIKNDYIEKVLSNIELENKPKHCETYNILTNGHIASMAQDIARELTGICAISAETKTVPKS
jgi:hypothetical protein